MDDGAEQSRNPNYDRLAERTRRRVAQAEETARRAAEVLRRTRKDRRPLPPE